MTPRDEFEVMLDAATASAEANYRVAVASMVRGKPNHEAWDRFEAAYARAVMIAELIGLAGVYEPLKKRMAQQFARRLPFDPEDVDLDDEFLVGQFIEAIEQFEERVPDLVENVRALQGSVRAQAAAIRQAEEVDALGHLREQSVAVREALGRRFWVSDVDRGVVVNLRDLVAGMIESTDVPPPIGAGGKPQGGIVQFINDAQALGAHDLTRARLEMVYRNNLSTAFNDGQVHALRAPEVKAFIPLVMLIENRDRRTRGNPAGLYPDAGPHFQMNKYINTLDAFERQGIVPPNGHNCRGSIRAVSRAEADRLGLVDGAGMPLEAAIRRYNGRRQGFIDSGVYPDRGFELRMTPTLAA